MNEIREAAYDRLLTELEGTWDPDEIPPGKPVARYVLVEQSTLPGGSHYPTWITCHDSPEEAARYHDNQGVPGRLGDRVPGRPRHRGRLPAHHRDHVLHLSGPSGFPIGRTGRWGYR